MPNYANSKLYRIVSEEDIPDYIGCTTQALSDRLTQHVSKYKKFGMGVGGYSSKHLIATGRYHIVWIEDYPCERKEQLRSRERYYIEGRVCINKNVPGRTRKESNSAYYQGNSTNLLAKKKAYYQVNSTKILANIKAHVVRKAAYDKARYQKLKAAASNPT
jgi:hypothetical protein